MWLVYAVAVLCAAVHTDAYSSGAPESSCQDMIPRHPVLAQNSTAPYTITTKINVVKSGTPLEVTLKGVTPEDTIRGLLLEARQGDRIVGKFTLDPNDPFARLINCGQPDSAVTHKKHSPEFDKQKVSFIWTPSADLKGDIRFRATIAYNGAVFWVGVESAPVKIN